MPDETPTGRAPVRRPSRGRARVGSAVGKAPHPDRAPTDVIPQDVPTSPQIFVDPSGVRRRRLRWVAALLGIALVVALVVIWMSQLSGPAGPPGRTACASAAPAAGAEACRR